MTVHHRDAFGREENSLSEQMIQRVRDRLVMRRAMPGDINGQLAMELECILFSLEKMADEARAASLRARSSS